MLSQDWIGAKPNLVLAVLAGGRVSDEFRLPIQTAPLGLSI